MCLPSLTSAIGPLRTRQLFLFSFWRVPAFPCSGDWAAPHTSALAFSSPACAFLPLQRRLGRSAHVSSCFFLSGMCLPSLTAAIGPLRTRQLLLFLSGVCLSSLAEASRPLRTRQLFLFSFWRVPAFPCRGVRAAPHTSALAFSFPACACLPLQRRQGCSAHVSFLFFLSGVYLPSPHYLSKEYTKKYNIFLARLPSPCYNIDKTKGPSKASGLLAMPGCLI